MRWLALSLLVFTACASTRKPEEEPLPVPDAVVEGNQEVSRRDLLASARRELRSFVSKGRRKADAADAAYAMELLLLERGFAHGRVEFAVEPERLVFTVAEGPRAYFGSVTFEGVTSFTRAELEKFFIFPGAGAFGGGEPLFRRSLVDAALTEVERFYLLAGFYRVEVGEATVRWNEERTIASVAVPVTEGRQYVVTRVDFEGVEPIDVGIVGQPYHVRLPVEAAARVRRKLLDEGRQRARVRPDVKVDDDRAEVVVTIQATPGPLVRLRNVTFTGQERTREGFLRRRIPIQDAELVAQKLLDRGLDNLYRSGLFSLVQQTVDPVGEDQGDLLFKLEELPAKSVDFELGYGSYELARGAVRFRDRNIFGIGRRFELTGSLSVRSWGADFRFEEPYLLGDRTTLEFGAGYLQREEPSFDLTEFSFSVVVTRRFKGPYRLRVGYGLRAEEAKNAPEDEDFGVTRTAGIFVSLKRDTRDSILLPSGGSVAEVAVAWSSPALGADLEFLELKLESAWFVRFGEQTVFGVGVSFRTREVLDDSGDLPIQERLFLGGEGNVRSFFESELGPEADGDPRGGLTAMYASVELRRQLVRQLHGALFYDVGNVARQAYSWEGGAGHAIGFGVRYYFPVGPARFDVGWNPGRRFAADSAWAFHLAFGFSF